MEQKILTPEMSASNDLRQRRQRNVILDPTSNANDSGDGSGMGDTVGTFKLLLSSPAATKLLWFYGVKLCTGFLLTLICAWVYASYVKQLHETHLWFSNIQVIKVSCYKCRYFLKRKKSCRATWPMGWCWSSDSFVVGRTPDEALCACSPPGLCWYQIMQLSNRGKCALMTCPDLHWNVECLEIETMCLVSNPLP